MSAIMIGPDVEVIDEPTGGQVPTATDPLFLLHTVDAGSPQGVNKVTSKGQGREEYAGSPALVTELDTYFEEGGGVAYVSPLAAADDPTTALDTLDSSLGPGQIVATEIVDPVDQTAIAEWGWTNNRFYIANAADGAADTALDATRDAIGAGAAGHGRYAGVEADTLLVPGVAGGMTRDVAASIVRAAHMARSDILTGNPNLTAAGQHTPNAAGVCRYVVGIKAERTQAQRDALAATQINTYRNVYGRIMGYGYRAASDLALLPAWWDISGSRTIMAARARELGVAERMMFGQVTADGAFLDKYAGDLSGELADLQRLGALFGTATAKGYSVRAGFAENPLTELQAGRVVAEVKLKTSPFAESLKVNIIRRAITQEV
jgi:hypothetical protein